MIINVKPITNIIDIDDKKPLDRNFAIKMFNVKTAIKI